MPNRLRNSTSPYLQQHAENPVDWFPWGPEALQKAREENKPIFLSIGYSSCHWCHVMERESFSHPEVAALLNALYVPIKVDREERPDLDHVYMTALQMMTGQGGWPLNVFLTPALEPYFGGTYFPLEAKYGRPDFPKVLKTIRDVFDHKKSEVTQNARQVTAMIVQSAQFFHPEEKLDLDALMSGIEKNIERNFEPEHGGLGQAPKFFHSDALRVLLHSENEGPRLQKVIFSLEKMARGGVYDQVGGGFHRYSTDLSWQIPHFEKMLYDNALLAQTYLEAFEKTQQPLFKRIAREIFEWTRRELYSSELGFFSAVDADSEHHEGKFYVWNYPELQHQLAAEDLRFLEKFFGLSVEGNFEGTSVLHLREDLNEQDLEQWERVKKQLLLLRQQRPLPQVDQKVLASWNGLMISALAKGSKVLNDPSLLRWASEAAEAVWKAHFREGRLLHSSFQGRVIDSAFLEDAAYFSAAVLDLYESSSDEKWFKKAMELGNLLLNQFFDSDKGGFWASAAEQTDLLVRYKEVFDGALPSPQSVALETCLRLFFLTGDVAWRQCVEQSLKGMAGTIRQTPGGFHRLWFVMNAFKASIETESTLERSSSLGS